MKVITIHPPYPSFVAYRLKSIETRKHKRFRGLVGQTIAIHASQTESPPSDALMDLWMFWGLTGLDIARAARHSLVSAGCIVAIADVTAHRRLTDADSAAALCPADGLYGLILDNVRRFREPIPATGHQRAWDWEPPENWEELVIIDCEHDGCVNPGRDCHLPEDDVPTEW